MNNAIHIQNKLDSPNAMIGLYGKEKTSDGNRMACASFFICLGVNTFRVLSVKKSKNPPDTTYVIKPTNVIVPPTKKDIFIYEMSWKFL